MNLLSTSAASAGELSNLQFALPIIQRAIVQDRPRLFNLADQARQGFGGRQWDTVISDATRGIVVGDFLTKVLNATAEDRTQAVLHIPIANSRTVSESMRSRLTHRKAVISYIRGLGMVKNALVVTDIVDTGQSLQRLGSFLHGADVRADYAVLAAAHTTSLLRRKARVPNASELYFPGFAAHEPETANSTILQGIGLKTVVGQAMPQPSEYAWPLVGLAVQHSYGALADEYIAQSS